MNFTYLSNRQVYYTLTGHDVYDNGEIKYDPFKQVELKETLQGEHVDISKAVEPSGKQDMKIGDDLSKITNRDRFEHSEGIVFAELTEKDKIMQSDLFEYSNDIDFNDDRIIRRINIHNQLDLITGIKGGVPTKERIAEYYGNMAKRLDEAYAEGKFTKEEYDLLNDGISERMEHSTVSAERNKAFYELGKKRGNLSPAAAKEVILRQKSMTPEEFQAELQNSISDYVKNFCKIDRTSLRNLFNSIRYGK